MDFTNLINRLETYEAAPALLCTKEGAVGLFCADCEFYKDSDKDLECGAFKLLRLLVEKKLIDVGTIKDAVT